MNDKKFEIKDNCGGIPAERAKNYAFKFGNTNKGNSRQFSIGHYGIGMKRTFFKIGNKISVQSASDKDFFSLIFDVGKWRKSPSWNIELASHGINNLIKPIGTEIKIEELNEDAKTCFSDDFFLKDLRKEIAKKYRDDLKNSISITVNDYHAVVSSRATEAEVLRCSLDEGSYTAEIIINKDVPNYEESGWNVFLNNRLVVSSDKTDLTGWNIGDKEEFHKLRGNIQVTAKNEGILPFNTTKDGLDTSNPIYNELKDFMSKALSESIPKFVDVNTISIKYERPRDEVEKMKRILKVKYAKNMGELTYKDYIERNRIKL